MSLKELVEITEALKRKKVVRGGKVVKKKVSDKEGYKTDKSGKEVKMSAKEKLARKKGAKRAAIKRRGKGASIARSKKKSLKKRKSTGL